MKIKRLNTGWYSIEHNGEKFEAETTLSMTDGARTDRAWHLFQIDESHQSGRVWLNEYWNLFSIKADIEAGTI